MFSSRSASQPALSSEPTKNKRARSCVIGRVTCDDDDDADHEDDDDMCGQITMRIIWEESVVIASEYL